MTYASKFRFCGGVVLATLLATFLAAAIASPVSLFGRPATQRRLVALQTPRLPSASAIRAGAVDRLFSDRDPAAGRFCNSCVQIGSQGISILLNEILNAGVIGGCGKLCGALPKGVERKGCDLACSVVGIKAFISVIKRGTYGRGWVVHVCVSKLQEARSRLYQRRFLQPNTHLSAFFEIYKIYKPLHRYKLKN